MSFAHRHRWVRRHRSLPRERVKIRPVADQRFRATDIGGHGFQLHLGGRRIAHDFDAALQIAGDPRGRYSLIGQDRRFRVGAHDPLHARVKPRQNIKLFGHDPQRLDDRVRGSKRRDFAIDRVVVDDIDGLCRHAEPGQHIDEKGN
ncbi:MAG TPA: hypothetical protein VGM07_10820 [Stellaceae bacterium]|jgi:hypothetical protein